MGGGGGGNGHWTRAELRLSCLFVRNFKEQIFQQYPGTKPDLYKHYIDDIVRSAAYSKNECDDFTTS